MKPIKLTIDGITSFCDEQTVDFEKLSQSGIFCICGPTGSGKTTVLDCIILALYARNGNRGNLNEYINTGCDRGRITLDFTADGNTYRVYRELRRSGQNKSKLTDLDTGEVLADQTEDVNDKIKAMLKLNAKDFTKVVILEQGRFAEFMKMGERERFEVIANLFNLERFKKLKDTVAAAKRKYEQLEGELAASLKQYEGVTEAYLADIKKVLALTEKNLAENETALAAAQKKLNEIKEIFAAAEKREKHAAALAAAQAEIENLKRQAAELNAQTERLSSRKAELDALKKLSDEAAVTLHKAEECENDGREIQSIQEKIAELLKRHSELSEKQKAINGNIAKLNVQREDAQVKVKLAAEKLARLGYAAAGTAEADFAAVAVRAERDARDRIELNEIINKLNGELNELNAVTQRLFAEQNSLNAELNRQETELGTALQNYEKARLNAAAAAVCASLHDGGVCPVCGGIYHGGSAPFNPDSELIASLKKECERAEAAVKQTQDKIKSNGELYADRLSKLRAAEDNLRERQAKLGKLPPFAQDAYSAAAAAAEDARRLALTDTQLNELAAECESLAAKIESVTAEGKTLRERESDLKNKIAARLGGASPAAAKAEADLAIERYKEAKEAAEREQEALTKAQTANAAELAAATAKAEAEAAALAELPQAEPNRDALLAASVEAEKIADSVNRFKELKGKYAEQLSSAKQQLAKKKELAAQKKKASETLNDLLKLNSCVSGENKLLSYVSQEYVKSFTAAASETLNSLSGGKYTLVYEDGAFSVLDFFADNAKRNVQTLSGGETFLASISIAIAISREIASQNYEFFFIDEGFGTLHERAMETVADALISLSRQTTVGIVTHRNELADKIPVRLSVIPATEVSGSKFELCL